MMFFALFFNEKQAQKTDGFYRKARKKAITISRQAVRFAKNFTFHTACKAIMLFSSLDVANFEYDVVAHE